jgi:hypothetical protein
MESVTVREMAVAQLRMIELSYDIRITNLKEIAERIAAAIEDERGVLPVMTVLNTYVAQNSQVRTIRIPDMVIRAAIGSRRYRQDGSD